MRKFIATVLGIMFLFSLPGLTRAYRSNLSATVLVGASVFALVLLGSSIYFWVSGRKQEQD